VEQELVKSSDLLVYLNSVNLLAIGARAGARAGAGAGAGSRVGSEVGETVIPGPRVGRSSELRSSSPDQFSEGVTFSHRASIC
jgi:hypothetical protein